MKRRLGTLFKTGQIRQPDGILNTLTLILVVGLTVFQIWAVLFGSLSPFFHNSIFISFSLAITFIVFSSGPLGEKDKIPFYDIIISLMLVAIGIYMFANHEYFLTRWPLTSPLSIIEMAVGIVLLVLIYEVTRRTLGGGMTVIVSLLILYAFFGHLISGTFSHPKITLMMFIDHMAYTSNGVFGTIASVAATYVFFFVLFGNLFNASGGGNFFYALSKALTGKVAGGPAKVAVISSGLYGSISGSPVADVTTTGSFAIPAMKKAGYSPEYAGAVEASASTGGSFLPPIMGSAAFLMVEITGIPYASIIKGALLPALLYYLSIFLQVHFQAKKLKLGEQTDEEFLNLWNVFKKMGQFVIPIVVLVGLLVNGYTPTFCAIMASIATIVVSYFKKETRMTPKKILDTLYESISRLAPLIAVCAAAGLVVGVINVTGFGGKFSSLIQLFAGDSILFTLLTTAVICIIFGMGMPTPAAYVLTAVLAAPTMVENGVPLFPAHLFIVFFACLSAITPPVAIAAFAASAIANADPMKIAILAVRLGIVGFIIPFMFVYNPGLLMVGSFSSIIIAVLTMIAGIIALASGLEGWFGKIIVTWERIVLIFSGFLLIYPGLLSGLIGLLIVCFILMPKLPMLVNDFRDDRKIGKSIS